jgi:hypothetical protein
VNVVVNLLCFALGFWISWKFVQGKLGMKQLSETCVSLFLTFAFIFSCAKYFDVGFHLLPQQEALKAPEATMRMSVAIMKVILVFFPICYIFEWWYYRKNPDIDPYTGKKKEPVDDDKI